VFEDSSDHLAKQMRHFGIARQSELEMDRILHGAFEVRNGLMSVRSQVDAVRHLGIRSDYDSVNRDLSAIFPRHLDDPLCRILEAGLLSTTGIERVLEDRRRFDRILEEQRNTERFYRPLALEATRVPSA
jgi:hypothetical protein